MNYLNTVSVGIRIDVIQGSVIWSIVDTLSIRKEYVGVSKNNLGIELGDGSTLYKLF